MERVKERIRTKKRIHTGVSKMRHSRTLLWIQK